MIVSVDASLLGVVSMTVSVDVSSMEVVSKTVVVTSGIITSGSSSKVSFGLL